jgi:hypothetical protein
LHLDLAHVSVKAEAGTPSTYETGIAGKRIAQHPAKI